MLRTFVNIWDICKSIFTPMMWKNLNLNLASKCNDVIKLIQFVEYSNKKDKSNLH